MSIRVSALTCALAVAMTGFPATRDESARDPHAAHRHHPAAPPASARAPAPSGSPTARAKEHVHPGGDSGKPAARDPRKPSKPHAEHAEHAEHVGHAAAPGDQSATTPPKGYSEFKLDLARAHGLGLATATVEERDFSRTLRTVGVVALDETKTSHVHAKVRGFIEGISVDFVGKRVRQGQPLVTIYSQEVYAAELEFLSILEQPSSGVGLTGEFASAERRAREQLFAAARRRLSLWDVPKSEIERLERTRAPKRAFTLVAPRAGVVVAKQALAGMFIDPSVELYLISDVRKLWVLADVYGTDVPFLEKGGTARLSIEGTGSEPLAAKVSFIPPTIDEATRTLKVRFDVDNRDGRARPGAFATVEMDLRLGRGLAIPEDAVIHAGPRAIVFVVRDGNVEPREVVLGPNVSGSYRVEKGLRAGDQVATGAQFLLDSESRLRASSGPGAAHAGH
jgi:membrane fusion protein, copper/silver efflux system